MSEYNSWLLILGCVFVLGLMIFRKPKGNKVWQELLNSVKLSHPHFSPTKKVLHDKGCWSLYIDEKSHLVLISTKDHREWKVYDFNQLIKSEVVEDGNTVSSTVRSSQAIGAVLGNMLVPGGAGLIVGGLSGKSRSRNEVSKVVLSLIVNDAAHALWTLTTLSEKKPILRSKKQAQDALNTANEAHALISALIRQADDAQKATVVRAQTAVQADVAVAPKPVQRLLFADEFMKLAKLRDQGILSDAEFTEMKTALITKAKTE